VRDAPSRPPVVWVLAVYSPLSIVAMTASCSSENGRSVSGAIAGGGYRTRRGEDKTAYAVSPKSP
jgi:hypothetical protein